MADSDATGFIGEIEEEGFPVVYNCVSELPSAETRQRFRWLTVISWKYDGTERNGMPPKEVNVRMISLELELDALETEGHGVHAYSRTGNSLKEFAYYIEDRDAYMAAFNEALEEHPAYPIEINFYDDPEWEDFQRVLEMFREAMQRHKNGG